MEPVEEQPARKSHSIAIEGFDGKTEVVEADELRVCVPTKECIQFWATIVACFVVIGLGVFFMVFQGPTSAYYSVGLTMIGLGSGVLIPGTLSFFRHFDDMQQAPIMVSWHRQGRPNSCPKVGMTAQRVQSNGRQIMSPSSRCRSASYEKVACLHLQKPRLEFHALHKHRVEVTVLKFRLGKKTLPLQPEGFLFKDKAFQVSAPHKSTQILVQTTTIQNITCPKLQVRGRKDQWWK